MNRISILLFAVVMAGSLSAQIESFSESDIFVSTPSQPAFDKLIYLQPFEGNMSPKIRCTIGTALKLGDTPESNQRLIVYNLIGEQLFGISPTHHDPIYTNTGDCIKPETYNFIVVKKNNVISLKKFPQGNYYIVKDILITKEEIDSLKNIIENCEYIGDTLVSSDGKWIDNMPKLPKGSKMCIIPREVVLQKLFDKESYDYTEWPTSQDILKDKSYKEHIVKALYVISDEEGNEYYIPSHKNKGMRIINKKDVFIPGYLVGISDFITVKGFTELKKIFENKRLVNRDRKEFLCKKIAVKDGYVVAAITDTLSTEISYYNILDFCDARLNWRTKDYVKVLATGNLIDNYDNSYSSKNKVDYWYFTKHDLDSVEAKIAYEERMEEQDKLRKDERKKQDLIKRYGSKIGQSIADGKACVGMNKEQCKEALGTPDNITKNTSNLGSVEVWTYSLGYQIYNGLIPITVVTFLDNKVTSVDEYSSWPY